MSVALTTDAVLERRKTVTRRAGWATLKPGTTLELCRKVMGRRADEPLERLCQVRVVSVRREPLNLITDADVHREGFTHADLCHYGPPTGAMLADRFVAFFTQHMGGEPDQIVTRVEWEYLT